MGRMSVCLLGSKQNQCLRVDGIYYLEGKYVKMDFREVAGKWGLQGPNGEKRLRERDSRSSGSGFVENPGAGWLRGGYGCWLAGRRPRVLASNGKLRIKASKEEALGAG